MASISILLSWFFSLFRRRNNNKNIAADLIWLPPQLVLRLLPRLPLPPPPRSRYLCNFQIEFQVFFAMPASQCCLYLQAIILQSFLRVRMFSAINRWSSRKRNPRNASRCASIAEECLVLDLCKSFSLQRHIDGVEQLLCLQEPDSLI